MPVTPPGDFQCDANAFLGKPVKLVLSSVPQSHLIVEPRFCEMVNNRDLEIRFWKRCSRPRVGKLQSTSQIRPLHLLLEIKFAGTQPAQHGVVIGGGSPATERARHGRDRQAERTARPREKKFGRPLL